uniref:Uncharacterized protein n=1 Tax=Nicotiana tabacum TaxID=4097 RepID=A0A1S4BV26_TOBAC|nr:PREDICTED: uncharacterized protein LOC107812159 [Nicotiana tabacum]
MEQDSKRARAVVGEDTEDRLSHLPRKIIDHILSSCRFRTQLEQHIGDIVKFDLDVSGVNLSSYANIDRWMLSVTRNGVKELTFNKDIIHVILIIVFAPKLLSAHTVPKGLPVVLRCVRVLSLSIDFGKLDQTSFTLKLIRGSFKLSRHEIWVCDFSDNAEAALSYLEMAACLDRPLNNLENVTMHWFKGSKTELLLVKLLFARAPSLVRMSIKPKRAMGSREERDVTTELMRFPRASPKAELIYLPNAD